MCHKNEFSFIQSNLFCKFHCNQLIIPVGSVVVGALVCCVAALNVGKAGLAATGVLNVNVVPVPNAGADVVVAACAPNEIVGVVVAGVPNDNELPVVDVAPVEQ